MIKCGECGAEISDKAAACVKCGAPVMVDVPLVAVQPLPVRIGACPNCTIRTNLNAEKCEACQMELKGMLSESTRPEKREPLPKYEDLFNGQENRVQVVKPAKSRGVYVILGLFFGLLGVHNFYIGRFGVGAAQLLITCILGWFVVGLVISAIWALLDLFLIDKDGAGDALA